MVSVTYDNHDPYITRKTNNYTIYIVSKGSVDNAISRLEWCDRYTTCDMKILISRYIKPTCHYETYHELYNKVYLAACVRRLVKCIDYIVTKDTIILQFI